VLDAAPFDQDAASVTPHLTISCHLTEQPLMLRWRSGIAGHDGISDVFS
jgi:hypothetical protein